MKICNENEKHNANENLLSCCSNAKQQAYRVIKLLKRTRNTADRNDDPRFENFSKENLIIKTHLPNWVIGTIMLSMIGSRYANRLNSMKKLSAAFNRAAKGAICYLGSKNGSKEMFDGITYLFSLFELSCVLIIVFTRGWTWQSLFEDFELIKLLKRLFDQIFVCSFFFYNDLVPIHPFVSFL